MGKTPQIPCSAILVSPLTNPIYGSHSYPMKFGYTEYLNTKLIYSNYKMRTPWINWKKNIHRSHGATVQHKAFTIPSFKSSPNSSNVHFHPFHMPLPATTSCSNRGNPPQNILVQLLFLSDHETEYSQRYLIDINGCKVVQLTPPLSPLLAQNSVFLEGSSHF